MKTLFLFISLAFSTQAFSQLDSAQTEQAKVFTFVEENPQFPGGLGALIEFIQKNLRYPAEERSKNIQGKVLMRFVVMEDGSLSYIKIVRGVEPALDAEAIRLVKTLPKFIPGRQQGKPVKVYYNMPVIFKL